MSSTIEKINQKVKIESKMGGIKSKMTKMYRWTKLHSFSLLIFLMAKKNSKIILNNLIDNLIKHMAT
jgi:hypothetical protein